MTGPPADLIPCAVGHPRITEQLIDEGAVERARLGITYGAASPALIEALGLPRGAAQVGTVVEDSPASGIQPGDVITEIDGKPLSNSLELSALITSRSPGEKVRLTLNRNGDEREVSARLAEATPDTEANTDFEPSDRIEEDLGFAYRDIDPETANRLGRESNPQGVLITEVDQGSRAFRDANLRPGQVIVELDGRRVRNVREFESVYDGVAPGGTFLLKLLQSDGRSTMVTALRKPD